MFDSLFPDLRKHCSLIWLLGLPVNDDSQRYIRVIENRDTFQLAHEVDDAFLGLLTFYGC